MRDLIKEIVSNTNAINAYSTQPRPQYPFTTYQITNTRTKDYYHHLETKEDSQTMIREPQVVLSIQSYGSNQFQAYDEIERMYDYFMFQGLLDSRYVVVNVSDIQDRSTILETTYEYAFGFDVWIRYCKTIDREVDLIETKEVDFEYEEQ